MADHTSNSNMADEYELPNGKQTRNPFYDGVPAGGRPMVIAPNVAEVFPDSALVNEVLRLVIKLTEQRHDRSAKPGIVFGGWLATIDPGVAQVRRRSDDVNGALRALIHAARSVGLRRLVRQMRDPLIDAARSVVRD